MKKFHVNLKKLRKERKVQQKDMAEYLGVSIRTYQRYEHGELEPNIEKIIRLAYYFGVTTDYLLGKD